MKTKSGPLFLLLFGVMSITLPLRAQTDDALPALVQLIGTSDDAQFQFDLLKGISEGLKGRRGVTMPAGWDAIATKLATSPNAQVRDLAQSLSVTFGSSSALSALQQTLLDAKADPKARQSALDSLLAAKVPSLAGTLQKLLKDPVIRAGALRGLAAYDDAQSAPAILETYSSFTAAEKKDALNTLASRAAFARLLLTAVTRKTIPTQDLTADVVRQLRHFKDADLNAQVTKLWGTMRESDADKLKEIARFKQMIQTKPAGQAAKGRVVFSRICQQCHTLFDVGGKVGPDITGSNRGDLDYILKNVLDPNAVIPNDYRTWNLETKDDRVITGILLRQDDNAVTLVTANDTLVIPRGEVASLTQGELSMMPEGLLQSLSEEEVCALIAYLRSPAQVNPL